MAITVNGVTGKEMWDSYRKGRAEYGPFVELSYLVSFASADAFVDGCMGGIVSTGGKGGTVRTVPKIQCPTNPKLYAMRAEYVGAGENYAASAGGRPVFSEAIVTVHFEVPTWVQAFSDDPGGMQSFPTAVPGEPIIFAECEIDMADEVVTMPPGAYVYVSDAKKLTISVVKHVPITTFRIVRHYFPYLPTESVASLIGKINNDTTFLGRARGLVRFAAARTRQVKTSDGTRTQMWEMTFQVKDRDWNDWIRDDTGDWDSVIGAGKSGTGDTSITPYSYANLAPLIA